MNVPGHSQLEAWAYPVIEACMDELPKDLKAYASNIPVICLSTPDDMVPDSEPDLLGLFTGMALEDGFDAASGDPTQIILFLHNIWDYAEGDVAAFQREVRITYYHELGHYFGWDEEDLAERGLD